MVDALLIFITALWGLTFVTVQDALAQADTFSFLALRFGCGAAAAALLAGPKLRERKTLTSGLLLSVFMFVGFLLQTLGLERTSASRSAFITGLSVVLVPVVSWVLFRKRPRATSLVGIAFAAFGLYVLTGQAAAGSSGALSGDLLTLGCAVSYAFHITLTERLAPKEGTMALVTVQLASVSLLSAACLPFTHPHVAWTPSFIGAFLFCGVAASAGAIGVQTWAQARISAVRAGLIFSLEPVFASAYSVYVGREVLGANAVVGGSLIILGIVVSEAGAAWLGRRGSRATVV